MDLDVFAEGSMPYIEDSGYDAFFWDNDCDPFQWDLESHVYPEIQQENEPGKCKDADLTGGPRRTLISVAQKIVLNEWISTHSPPYPTKEEKLDLARSTGLTVDQVSGWFTRTRQRKLRRMNPLGSNIFLKEKASHSKGFKDPSRSPKGRGWSMASFPLRPRRHSGKNRLRSERKCWSEPPVFNFGHLLRLQGRTETLARRERHSLDVHHSTQNMLDYCISQAGASGSINLLEERLSLHSSPESRAASITRWLQTLHVEEPAATELVDLGAAVTTEEHIDYRDDSCIFNAFIAAGLVSLVSPEPASASSQEKHQPYNMHVAPENLEDSASQPPVLHRTASIASNCSASSGYMSFGPRRGRRVAFHSRSASIESLASCGPSSPYADTYKRQSDWGAFGEPEGKRRRDQHSTNIPRLDRIMTDIYSDELYSPNFSISTPSQDVFMQRLKAANAQHLVQTDSLVTPSQQGIPAVECEATVEPSMVNPPEPEVERFQCTFSNTFCNARFSKAYSWRRHEESVHAPQRKWVCGPPRSNKDVHESTQCPLCDSLKEPNTFDSRIGCLHEISTCWRKPEVDRTFYRKDALKQHIALAHCKANAFLLPPNLDLDTWAVDIDEKNYDLACHFCGYQNRSWTERAQHLIEHFNNDATMDMWKRDKPQAPVSVASQLPGEAMLPHPPTVGAETTSTHASPKNTSNKPSRATNRRCANCKQLGHIKTNRKLCPLLNGLKNRH